MATAVSRYERVKDDALQLPQEDRSKLASELFESLDDGDVEVDSEWRKELGRRVRDIDEGRAKLVPHDEVMADVRARVEEIRGRAATDRRRDASQPPPKILENPSSRLKFTRPYSHEGSRF